MSKTIDTLVDDIYQVVERNGGWDATVSHLFADTLTSTVSSRLEPEEEERKPSLRMSNIGHPCKRKLWYDLNSDESEEIRPDTKLKFLFGGLIIIMSVSYIFYRERVLKKQIVLGANKQF